MCVCTHIWGFPSGSGVQESTCNAGVKGDIGSIPGSGRSPGGRHGNPLQYSCLENPMNRGAWRATVHSITRSGTRLKGLSTHIHVYIHKEGHCSHSYPGQSRKPFWKNSHHKHCGQKGKKLTETLFLTKVHSSSSKPFLAQPHPCILLSRARLQLTLLEPPPIL